VHATDNTFEAVFKRWRAFKALGLKVGRQSTLSQIDRTFAKDVLPWLAKLSVFEMKRANVLDVLQRIERRQAYTMAEKCRTWLNQLFRYAMVEVDLETNPAADLDIVAMPKPPVTHNPFLRMDELPAFLQKLRNYRDNIKTQLGVRLLFLTGVRTGELRSSVPDQFVLVRGLWIIPTVNVKQLKVRARKQSKEIPPIKTGTATPHHDGIIDEVLRPLKSGKEAKVYLVRSGTQIRCAKVYPDRGYQPTLVNRQAMEIA
jgi:integrase